ncbi:MAG TPA: protein kinase family protein [Dictyobacter sp.]|jgi:serine/threonine protein kinase|nr:protein kinase family protein [Dictyobacter sp.]
MSVSPDQQQSDILRCKRCNAELIEHATFCSQCGERVPRPEQSASVALIQHTAISPRYRITSLARRRSNRQLFIAIDTLSQRPVIINDINISSLDEQTQAQAIASVQEEYDLLRRLHLPAILPLVDLRLFHDHLYIIASWKSNTQQQQTQRLTTLHNLLQGDFGLPNEQVALAWIYRLSRTLDQLHKQKIVIGDIDSEMIILNEPEETGDPAFMVSWLPGQLRTLRSQSSTPTNTTNFSAPETAQGMIEPCSDIYSLGATLYLLLTGMTPAHAEERRRHPLRTLHEFDAHVNTHLDALVSQSLALEKSERIPNAKFFSETLLQLLNTISTQSQQLIASQNPSLTDTQKGNEEINVSSRSADNKINQSNITNNPSFPKEHNATMSIVPLQSQMARRFLSKVKNSQSSSKAYQSGEEPVEGQAKKRMDKETPTRMNKYPDSPEHPTSKENMQESHTSSTAELAHTQPIDTDVAVAAIDTDADSTAAPDNTSTPDASTTHTEKELKNNTNPTTPKQAAKENQEDIADTPTRLVSMENTPKGEAPTGVQSITSADESASDATITVAHQSLPTVPQTDVPEELEPEKHTGKELALTRFKNMLSGSLPAISRLTAKANMPGSTTTSTSLKDSTFIQRMRQFILGEQQQTTSAAALIETPMRIQPDQSYTIRINVIGRAIASDANAGGLSALSAGENVHIEVRSAIYQNYAYVVQQADVQLPGAGFVAEVTMPMQPLTSGPSGRRERLHIFFMDDKHNPLYEKPFVIELFVSHLVQNGREGHNVLSIPI